MVGGRGCGGVDGCVERGLGREEVEDCGELGGGEDAGVGEVFELL